jgi:hypothetical protein
MSFAHDFQQLATHLLRKCDTNSETCGEPNINVHFTCPNEKVVEAAVPSHLDAETWARTLVDTYVDENARGTAQVWCVGTNQCLTAYTQIQAAYTWTLGGCYSERPGDHIPISIGALQREEGESAFPIRLTVRWLFAVRVALSPSSQLIKANVPLGAMDSDELRKQTIVAHVSAAAKIRPDRERLVLSDVPEIKLADAGGKKTLELEARVESICAGTVTIVSQTGKTIKLPVEWTDTIESVQNFLQVKWDIPADQQRFIYVGKQMEPGRTLADYGIEQPGATIHLALRFRGGMYHWTSGRRDMALSHFPDDSESKWVVQWLSELGKEAKSRSVTCNTVLLRNLTVAIMTGKIVLEYSMRSKLLSLAREALHCPSP